jgi:hypothetical protein
MITICVIIEATAMKEINMGNWKDNGDGTSTFVGCGDSHDVEYGTVAMFIDSA